MKHYNAIFILAKLYVSEWIRLKFFHIIIFFGVIFIGFSHLLSSLTFSVQERLLYDFGLAGLELGIILISSLIGTHSIQREIDRKTLFVLLARPFPRSFVIFGSWLSILTLCLLFSVGFYMSLMISSGNSSHWGGLLMASFSSFLKTLVVSSFAIALGLLVRPILAFGATLSYWILCYSIPDIRFFISKLNDQYLLDLINWIDKLLPQFYLYNWKSFYYMNNMPLGSEIAWSVFHSLGWALIWIFIAVQVFRRKEIV